MSSKYRKKASAGNPFEVDEKAAAQEADAAIFSGGQAEGLVDVRVVAMPTPLTEIWADVKQPRRAIPASIRLSWNGDPAQVKELLLSWEIAARRHGLKVTPGEIIRGSGEGVESDALHPVAAGYLELLRLAQDIRRVGLTNPISVVKQSGRFLIESGERRYLAYWLLYLLDGDQWQKILALTSTGKDFVWRQASENTARRALNAIGMARQLALLIMDARSGEDGQKYDRYEDMVLPGECDRKFYAQVANGNIHRIPKGYGERIQSAMNLSAKRIGDYRRLLKMTDDDVVNDALWIRADVEDWAEYGLREIADTSPVGEVRKLIEREEWTLEDLRALVPASVPPVDEHLPTDGFPSITVGSGQPVGSGQASGTIHHAPTETTPVLDLESAGAGEQGRLAQNKRVWSMGKDGMYGTRDEVLPVGTVVKVKQRFTQNLKHRRDHLMTVTLADGQEKIINVKSEDVGNPPGDVPYRDLATAAPGMRLRLITHKRVWLMTKGEGYKPTHDFLDPGTVVTVISSFTQAGPENISLVMVKLKSGMVVALNPDSDKVVSATPEVIDDDDEIDIDDVDETDVPNDLMLNPESPEFAMLTALLNAADAYGEGAVRRAIMSAMLLSFDEAKEMAGKGTLHRQLNEYYQDIERGMQGWLNRISDFFMYVEENVR